MKKKFLNEGYDVFMNEKIEGERFENFPSLKLIFSFIGCEHGVAITEKDDRKSLFPMFLKSCIHCLRLKFPLLIYLMKIGVWTFLEWWSILANLQRSLLVKNC
jgi:hypothetical protein